ncbi:MAG: DUF87 domain-containing protein, partial [Patescibacteria group bacterium]
MFWLYLALGIVGLVLAAWLIYLALRLARRRSLISSLQLGLFLVKIPRAEVKEGEKMFKLEINKFEQFLSSLGALKKPFVLETAVPHVGEEIHFYLAVPKTSGEVAIKQLQGLWNGASVTQVSDDYNIFNPTGAAAGAYLLQKESYALPIRTYQELESDSFASVLGGLSKVNKIGEGAAVQLVVRPAGNDAKKRIKSYIESLKKGESLKRVFGHEFPFKPSEIMSALNPKKEEEERKKDKIIDEEAVKALEAKISKPLFMANVRVLASASTPFQANDILDGLLAGFEQFGSPRRNEFKTVKVKNAQKLAYNFIFREFVSGQAMTLSSEEIASFYHFPTSSTETPRVKWLKSKEAPPPANIPNQGIRIGQSFFRGEAKPIYITDDDRRRHLYTVGQTGTGKSTLLGNLVIQDIQAGRGVAVIDPHGDLADSILAHIPRERMDDLIYFDPADIWKPLGLNMLDYNQDRPEEKTFIVNEMQGIFNKLFLAETMGPMFEQYMRNALLLLMEDMANEPATLVEVPRIFTDVEYRRRKLARIKNPIVIDFWEKEAIKAGGEASLAN